MGGPVNIQAASIPGYTGERILRVRRRESLKKFERKEVSGRKKLGQFEGRLAFNRRQYRLLDYDVRWSAEVSRVLRGTCVLPSSES